MRYSRKDAIAARDSMLRTGLPFTYIPISEPKLTERQADLLDDMRHGWSLESYRVIGEGRVYVLCRKGQTRLADKRTVNSLLKRKAVVLFKHEGYATTGRSYWTISEHYKYTDRSKQ